MSVSEGRGVAEGRRGGGSAGRRDVGGGVARVVIKGPR
jgi:hypothetical protein